MPRSAKRDEACQQRSLPAYKSVCRSHHDDHDQQCLQYIDIPHGHHPLSFLIGQAYQAGGRNSRHEIAATTETRSRRANPEPMDNRVSSGLSRAARVLAEDLSISDDQLMRLERAELLPRWESVKTSAAAVDAYVTRVHCIVGIFARIGTKKPRAPEIAFWLAYYGFDVPGELVLIHLEDAVRRTITLFRRFLDRLGPGRLTDHPSIDKLAGLVAKALVKRLASSESKFPGVQTMATLGVALVLRALLKRATFEAVAGPLRLFVSWLSGNKNPDSISLRSLWDILSEAMQLFRLDDSNVMLLAVRNVNATEPDIVVEFARTTRGFLEVAGQMMPWLLDARVLADRFGNIADYNITNRYLAPGICAMLLLERHRPETQENIRKVQAGDTARLAAEFATIIPVAEHVASAFAGLAG